MHWTYGLSNPKKVITHGDMDPWLEEEAHNPPCLRHVCVYLVGPEEWNPEAGYSPSDLRESFLANDLAWLAERMRRMLLLDSKGVMINPARAALHQVDVLEQGLLSYFTIPPGSAPLREDGNPRTACYFVSGIVAKSMLRQPASRGEGTLLRSSDHRINIWGLRHEFQRALAYLGAVSHQTNLVYDSFLGECLVFQTRPEGSSNVLGSSIWEDKPKVYFQGSVDPIDGAEYFASYDFPNGLTFDTEANVTPQVPVYDATYPSFEVGENVWEDVKKLPRHIGEVSTEAVVTVAYTAELVYCPFAIPPSRKVELYVQFVIIHKM
ncbi:hypothetical protein DFP72DRAFT_1083078 [Ephemerocybe angulata]|uniref:Uncharacterized protein n=1 Tax=Ephemerocybe angulata TaxID=980116 RepID=A0A8H6H7A9_9AGAR|nr:hypothetical protein DFP72DRAFT_1083078 [Tulosesus angulatus]